MAKEMTSPLISFSALSFSTAWFSPWAPSALRETNITLRAPALRNAVAACNPNPREPEMALVSASGPNVHLERAMVTYRL